MSIAKLYFNIISCLGFFTVFGVGILVYLKNRKSLANRFWFALCVSASFWSLLFFLIINSNNLKIIIFMRLLLDSCAILLLAFWYFFVRAFLGISRKKISYFISFLTLGMLILNSTPIMVKGMVHKYVFNYYVEAGIGYYVFALYFSAVVIYSLFLLFRSYKTFTGFKANQIKYMIVSSIMGFAGGGSAFFLSLNIPIPPYPLILFTTFPLAISYAILKYRLMDIRVAITRTGIFIAVYTIVLGIPFAVAAWLKPWFMEKFGAGWWMAPLVLMALLATVGPFIYIYIQRKAEERLLKEQKRYQETLKQASVGMTRIRNLRKLLDLITHIVTKTVRIAYAAIYLYNDKTDEYILQVSRDKDRIPILKLNADNPLIAWISVKREPLIYEEVKRQMQDTGNATYKFLEENMRLLTASVIIPSSLEDRFLGFIVLGEKISGQIYTPDDLNVFQILASQAALAIENAQFYEDTKEMQEQIAQAEKMSTVGTMADGLSHQINNRFHALSLIAGDSIDTIKMTDTSQCTPEVREMIKQINYALGRIQSNVMQGAEVVKGILKYTRKGEEGFEALGLDQILDGTLEMVQFKVKLSEIDIVRDYPKDTPKIKGNLTQLEEVFFNFIDNAYDAIVERRELLKEDGYRGRLTVLAHPKDNVLEIIIEDNGLGIKDDNREKIFTPFFTTKTSARRGTGLGLYVIKRIIADIHKGKIIFESDYKFGTRFIVELPIAR